ncbi:MAG: hypothetical protein JWM47_1736 [Acidimicrobiales bacterium]|nr:hypothetical protein [Acidimicrobiales bacterium]
MGCALVGSSRHWDGSQCLTSSRAFRCRVLPVFGALGIFALHMDRIEGFFVLCVVGDDGVSRTRAKERKRLSQLAESQNHTSPEPDPLGSRPEPGSVNVDR